MILTQETIRRVLRAARQEADPAEIIHEALAHADGIRRAAQRLDQEEAELFNEHQVKTHTLNQKREELQRQCRHLQRVFQGDPSGGGDSEYRCELCGKVSRH